MIPMKVKSVFIKSVGKDQRGEYPDEQGEEEEHECVGAEELDLTTWDGLNPVDGSLDVGREAAEGFHGYGGNYTSRLVEVKGFVKRLVQMASRNSRRARRILPESPAALSSRSRGLERAQVGQSQNQPASASGLLQFPSP